MVKLVKFIKGSCIHFLQYVIGEKTVPKRVKCQFQRRLNDKMPSSSTMASCHLLNMMLFCVLHRELTPDSPNAFHLKYQNIVLLIEIFKKY